MMFRPLLWPTLVSIPALLTLLMLGTWQVQRLQWKTALIAEYTTRATSQAVYPDSAAAPVEFQRISAKGVFVHDKTIYLTGRTYEGNAGFHVVTPLKQSRATCSLLIVAGYQKDTATLKKTFFNVNRYPSH